MEQVENLFYDLEVKVRESLTDPRAMERMMLWDFTLKEWLAFEKGLNPFYNSKAEKIVSFFTTYSKIDLCPDKYGPYEPLKRIFEKDDISDPISLLSFPSGSLLMKKRRYFDVAIVNLNYGLIYDPYDNYKVIPSKRKLGEYLGSIRIIIKAKSSKYSFDQMKTIVDDMCEYLNTDYGVISYLRTNEILYQYKK